MAAHASARHGLRCRTLSRGIGEADPRVPSEPISGASNYFLFDMKDVTMVFERIASSNKYGR
jgi:hypothetical protein